MKAFVRSGLFRLIMAFVLVVALGIGVLSRGPDFQLEFSREIAASKNVTPSDVDRVWRDVRQWPRWFYSLQSVELIGSSSPWLETGKELALSINPGKGSHTRFTLHAKVVEYVPEKRLVLRVTHDSKGRLTRIFDRLDWVVDVTKPADGSDRMLLKAEARAQTGNWRGRLFGRLSNRILMNQVFYPNLFKLAKINDPVTQVVPSAH
jgi:hypothetical protein